LLAWGLGYFGQPHILARFKAIRSKDDVPAARRIAVTWTLISLLGAFFVGIAGIGYFETPLADSETVFISLVQALFHPVVAGILLAAILAAIMSTADSQLLVSSAALTEDFYKSIFNKDASPESLVKIGRFAVVGLAILAWILALDPESSVLGLVSYAWAGFGAAFGPAVILSLFWSRMNRQGCLAGILVGGITVVVWKQLSGGMFDVYEIVPGFILAAVSIIVVSLLTPAPKKEIQDMFTEVENS
jgi:sodium/proline symporter